ncbi:DinB family protein [Neorhodopirellula pilleata]|uniref:DinB superfamily protein n=1 Tax=Neorhodopirellula pilleata TaxID=2714738 RepID=A0A5C6AR14_9BACT|nr:DinB family protein [Neorhodopirellula pilleata]TWU01911.1 DinB superfamily protein [Neorhodopirellula pilleata]
MDAKTLIRQTIATTEMICNTYLADLTDEDLLHRPVAGANHINWQWGHLIASEKMLGDLVKPGAMPSLPEGFEEKYGKETAAVDDADQFATKAELQAAQQTQREALMALLDNLSVEELSNPAPEQMAAFFPNAASLILSADSHWMMHAGQWAVVRRALGKPPLF